MIIAILILLILVLGVYTVRLKTEKEKVIKINIDRRLQNQQIEETNKNLKIKREEICQQLEDIKGRVSEETERLASIVEKNKELEENANKRAQEFYEKRIKELKATMEHNLEVLNNDYQAQKNLFLTKFETYREKIADMERQQEAYLQARRRQEEIDANQDYYRLAIDKPDLDDISLLRDMQPRFVKKESIDKLIWDIYFKPAYDILMSHISDKTGKICGIYKITDLTTGLAYIGQSVDIRERARQHIKSALSYGKATNKLYQQMQKSGVHNFTFEIIEEVSRDKLNEREAYWIEFYKTKEWGLNSTKGNN